jgi:transcriptional repressor NF-X1
MRESGCGHPCPLACHPGPCPPCQVTTQSECYCPKKTLLAFRCGVDRGGPKRNGRDLTCGSVCGRTLGCRKHTCERVCHDGDCDACAIREVARCLCGKAEKEVSCGDGEAVVCFVENEEEWIGRFRCLDPCGRSVFFSLYCLHFVSSVIVVGYSTAGLISVNNHATRPLVDQHHAQAHPQK